MTPAQQLIARWKSQGVAYHAGATTSELATLSAFLETALPADAVDFYLTVNGTGGVSPDLVSFWPIERILSDPWVRTGSDERGPYREVAFGDVLINSWFFYFRVRQGAVSVFAENTAAELPTLEDLLHRYVSDPESLLI